MWTHVSDSTPTGKHCSNYGGEILAFIKEAAWIQEAANDCQAVVFIDARSTLESVANDKEPQLMENL